ncbi:DDE_3 domain-containing protein [Trichonephila clavipes]|nr:DDE_3 domain-containing protein [Trichonephila clavipes]
MDDNVGSHRSIEVSDTLQRERERESKNILRIQWSAYSPDLNPIEHSWDALGRCIAQRTTPLRTVQELKTTLREEWDHIPQGFLDSLVKSMENRCKMCISVRSQLSSYYGTHVCSILT